MVGLVGLNGSTDRQATTNNQLLFVVDIVYVCTKEGVEAS